jgi:hypothetical protein
LPTTTKNGWEGPWLLTEKILHGTFMMERWVFDKGQEAFPAIVEI